MVKCLSRIYLPFLVSPPAAKHLKNATIIDAVAAKEILSTQVDQHATRIFFFFFFFAYFITYASCWVKFTWMFYINCKKFMYILLFIFYPSICWSFWQHVDSTSFDWQVAGYSGPITRLEQPVNHDIGTTYLWNARFLLWLRSPVYSGTATIIHAVCTAHMHFCTYIYAVKVIRFTLCTGRLGREKNKEFWRKRNLEKIWGEKEPRRRT